MSAAQMRPTFILKTSLSAADAMHCIRQTLVENGDAYRGQFTSGHAMISIDESRRHFWSPWMHVEIRSEEDQQHREIHGRFSPHPGIWTGFMFSYLAIGVLVLFAAMFGVSQQLSGQSPWAYYFIPVGLSVATALWLASMVGQKLAQAEMNEMKSAIEKCIAGKQK